MVTTCLPKARDGHHMSAHTQQAQTWRPDLGDARRASPKSGRQVWACWVWADTWWPSLKLEFWEITHNLVWFWQNFFLGLKYMWLSPWTNVSLDQSLLGQLSLGLMSPWTNVSLDNCPLDICGNTERNSFMTCKICLSWGGIWKVLKQNKKM